MLFISHFALFYGWIRSCQPIICAQSATIRSWDPGSIAWTFNFIKSKQLPTLIKGLIWGMFLMQGKKIYLSLTTAPPGPVNSLHRAYCLTRQQVFFILFLKSQFGPLGSQSVFFFLFSSPSYPSKLITGVTPGLQIGIFIGT